MVSPIIAPLQNFIKSISMSIFISISKCMKSL